MDAKTYLERVSKLDKLINNKLKEKEQWKSIAMGTSASAAGDRVQSSSSLQKMENAIIRAVELENEANEMIDRYINMKQEAISTIEMIEDAILYDILYKKYIDGIPLTDIAELCNYSWESTKRKHRKALKIIQEILDERYNDND